MPTSFNLVQPVQSIGERLLADQVHSIDRLFRSIHSCFCASDCRHYQSSGIESTSRLLSPLRRERIFHSAHPESSHSINQRATIVIGKSIPDDRTSAHTVDLLVVEVPVHRQRSKYGCKSSGMACTKSAHLNLLSSVSRRTPWRVAIDARRDLDVRRSNCTLSVGANDFVMVNDTSIILCICNWHRNQLVISAVRATCQEETLMINHGIGSRSRTSLASLIVSVESQRGNRSGYFP